MTMPRKSWAAHSDVKSDKIIAPFSECLPYAQEPDGELRQTGKWARVNELLQSAFDATVYKKMPAAELLKRFTEEANAVLAKNVIPLAPARRYRPSWSGAKAAARASSPPTSLAI